MKISLYPPHWIIETSLLKPFSMVYFRNPQKPFKSSSSSLGLLIVFGCIICIWEHVCVLHRKSKVICFIIFYRFNHTKFGNKNTTKFLWQNQMVPHFVWIPNQNRHCSYKYKYKYYIDEMYKICFYCVPADPSHPSENWIRHINGVIIRNCKISKIKFNFPSKTSHECVFACVCAFSNICFVIMLWNLTMVYPHINQKSIFRATWPRH
jgi:hypothetical protein